MPESKLDAHKQTRLVHYDNWEYKFWSWVWWIIDDSVHRPEIRGNH